MYIFDELLSLVVHKLCIFNIHLVLLSLFRAYFVWEKNIPVNLTQEQALRANLEDYKNKLRIADTTLPDPFTLCDGWIGEKHPDKWPRSVLF